MKINSQRDKRTYLIIALCLVLVVMGAGYAAFSSMLNINGTANISNSWCVGFDNTKTDTMQVTKGVSTGTQPTGSMTYSGTACGSTLQPNSSLNAYFYQPGDEIEYTLTITNKSTVAVAIKSILVDNESVTSNTTKKKGNITYVVEMPADTTLDVNESTTMKVIAKFQNETDVTGNVNGETQSIEVKINAEQDDGNGGMNITPATFTDSVYRFNSSNVVTGSQLNYLTAYSLTVDGEYGHGPSDSYETLDECEAALNNKYGGSSSTLKCKKFDFKNFDYTRDASTLNKKIYLKHDVKDNIITATYVCFVYNNVEHCMKGENGGTSYEANIQILKDYQAFYNLGDYADSEGCSYDSYGSFCYGGEFKFVKVYGGGRVDVEALAAESQDYGCEAWPASGNNVDSNCFG